MELVGMLRRYVDAVEGYVDGVDSRSFSDARN